MPVGAMSVMPVNVLLVDANTRLRSIVCRLLVEVYAPDVRMVGIADLGQEALNQATLLQPDVVLVGFGPSYQVAAAFVQELRTLLPDVGIIAMGDLSMRGYVGAVRAVGADAFVAKELLNSELLPVLRQVVQSRRP